MDTIETQSGMLGGRAPGRNAARCLMVLALMLAACHDNEGPVGPESSPGPDLAHAPANATVLSPVRFGAPQKWSSSFCRKGEVCLIADVDGNGMEDAIAFNHGARDRNAVYVARSTGTGFGPPEEWSNWFCLSTETCAVGDVNGDYMADIVAFTGDTANDVWVALSNGSGFGAPQKWSDFFCLTGEVCKVADVNEDKRADLIAFQHGVNGNNGVFVAIFHESRFQPAQLWNPHFCTSSETCEVGDVVGSRKSAIIAFTRDPHNDVYAGLSYYNRSGPPVRMSSFFCRTGEVCLSADFNGDRRDDVIAFNHGVDGANAVYVATSIIQQPPSFTPAVKASDYFCTLEESCAVGDVTGDGRADVIAFTQGTTPEAWVGISLP